MTHTLPWLPDEASLTACNVGARHSGISLSAGTAGRVRSDAASRTLSTISRALRLNGLKTCSCTKCRQTRNRRATGGFAGRNLPTGSAQRWTSARRKQRESSTGLLGYAGRSHQNDPCATSLVQREVGDRAQYAKNSRMRSPAATRARSSESENLDVDHTGTKHGDILSYIDDQLKTMHEEQIRSSTQLLYKCRQNRNPPNWSLARISNQRFEVHVHRRVIGQDAHPAPGRDADNASVFEVKPDQRASIK